LVLADLDFDVRQATPLAMYRDGIVGQISDAVRLIIAHHETVLSAQQFEERMREAPIAVVQNRGVPRARHSLEDWGEAVQRDQYRDAARRRAPVEHHRDRVVIRAEDRLYPRSSSRFAEAAIAGDLGGLADLGD